jgi:hypothetical protein
MKDFKKAYTEINNCKIDPDLHTFEIH